ncbi:MAG: PAS domain S-box protein [Deltaproteobacteria bacterium]|nr:PAS domain S-box protein [Deltaproteobacteria bacterium]
MTNRRFGKLLGQLGVARKLALFLGIPSTVAISGAGAGYFDATRLHEIQALEAAAQTQGKLAADLMAWSTMVDRGQREDCPGLLDRSRKFGAAFESLNRLASAHRELRGDLQKIDEVWPTLSTKLAGRCGAGTSVHDVEMGRALDEVVQRARAIASQAASLLARRHARIELILAIALSASMLVAFGGYLLAKRFVIRPIRDLHETTRRLGSPVLVGSRGDELSALGQTLDDLFDRIEKGLKALDQRRQFSERMLSAMPVGVLVLDTELRIREVNQAFLARGKKSESELLGRDAPEILGAPSLRALLAHVGETDEHQIGLVLQINYPGVSQPAPVRLSISGAGELTENRPTRILLIVEDLSEHEASVARVRSLEAQFRDVVESATDGIIVTDEGGHIVFANTAAEAVFGAKPGKLRGLRSASLFREVQGRGPDFRDLVHENRNTRLAIAVELRRLDGSEFTAEVSVGRYMGSEGIAFTAVVRDVTERRRDEAALRNADESFRLLLERSPDVILIDQGGVIAYANPQAALAMGYDSPAEIVGRATSELLAAGDGGTADLRLRNVSAAGVPVSPTEQTLARRDGTKLIVEIVAVPITFRGSRARALLARDITERKLLITRMSQMDRLVTLGTLAAGVGHEINNPLTYVLSNLTQLIEGNPDQALREKLLAEAKEGAERVRHVVRDLRALSTVQSDEPGFVDVRKAAEFAIAVTRNEVRHRAALRATLSSEPCYVLGSEARLGEVILNLVVNAAQAIPEGRAETNEIRVSLSKEDRQIVLEVSDTGQGIAPENLGRVFDPFFTTKGTGQGSGLGLSVAHALVTGMGGRISVQSQVGVGTTFRIELPASEHLNEPRKITSPPPLEPPKTSTRRRVLIVDDEPKLARAIQRSLAPFHDVSFVTSGLEALARITGGERYSAIVCDLMMPEVTGMDVHAALSARFPEQASRVVFLTGGAFTAGAREYLEKSKVLCLDKPFDPERLLAAIEAVASKTDGASS